MREQLLLEGGDVRVYVVECLGPPVINIVHDLHLDDVTVEGVQ